MGCSNSSQQAHEKSAPVDFSSQQQSAKESNMEQSSEMPNPDLGELQGARKEEIKNIQKVLVSLSADRSELEKQKEFQAASSKVDEDIKNALASGVANQISVSFANHEIENSRRSGAEQQAQEETQVVETFKSIGAKHSLRAALAEHNLTAARETASSMLQAAWRAKRSRRFAALKRAERDMLLKEGLARKIQSMYHIRKARRIVAKKRVEKEDLISAEDDRIFESRAAAYQKASSSIAPEEVAVTVLPDMKKGFVKKEGQFVHNEKERFFVLRSISNCQSRLTYYVREKELEPFGTDEKGFVLLKGAVLRSTGGNSLLISNRAENRDLKMIFKNAEEMASWKGALEKHIHFSNSL